LDEKLLRRAETLRLDVGAAEDVVDSLRAISAKK
jgi:hypothetical protein